ncbi:uncharacterized protein LOC143584926 [Bidens hawaiensis]|uniref:uncharacterized protein LOC143584926 n=1 Tax=Bidens hawaiensis TaxID=980011 RepID=UPI004049B49F
MGRKKSRMQDPEEITEKAPPPADANIINFLYGGSDICRTSFSSAKRHAKEIKLENGERPIRTTTLTNQRGNISKPGKYDVQGSVRKIIEIYIDDMVVKSKKAEDHLKDLEEAFNILDQYNMMLNPSKCQFSVKAG